MSRSLKISQPVTFECQCGVQHRTADGILPVGWTARGGASWCTDCTRSGIAVRQLLSGGHPRRSRKAA